MINIFGLREVNVIWRFMVISLIDLFLKMLLSVALLVCCII